jgi:hypothetical protein
LPNKPNSQISFSIEEGACSSYFEFPLTTRSDLAVRQLIEYDKLQHCELTIRAHDHGYPQLSSRTTVQIRIVDIDNKDPIFTRNMYAGYIKRNSQPGSLVNMTRDGKSLFNHDLLQSNLVNPALLLSGSLLFGQNFLLLPNFL